MGLVIDKELWAMGHLVITSGPHAQNRIGSIIIPQEIGVMDVWKISQVRTFNLLFFTLKPVKVIKYVLELFANFSLIFQ